MVLAFKLKAYDAFGLNFCIRYQDRVKVLFFFFNLALKCLVPFTE